MYRQEGEEMEMGIFQVFDDKAYFEVQVKVSGRFWWETIARGPFGEMDRLAEMKADDDNADGVRIIQIAQVHRWK